ncbi:MAG: choice-of-anchor B family protein [Bacteroidota bacterium]
MLQRFLAFFLVLAPLAALAQSPCTNGTATDGSTAYACDGVDLMAHLPTSTFATSGSPAPSINNDIWGWTDAASGREFALVGMSNGTAFVEVTDPVQPVFLGKLPTATSSSSWRDVKVYADHAFIVSEAFSHGMQVFDLSRLLSVSSPPVTFSADARYTPIGRAHNIVIDEDAGLAFGVGVRSGTTCSGGGLHVVDISTPTSPTFAGCYDADGYTHDAQCVTYDGPDTDHTGKSICVASNEDTLTIVDVSNPASPAQISKGFYPSPSYTHQGWFDDDQRYFVVNDELDGSSSTPTRTIVFDLTDLDSPSFEFFHSGTSNARDHNLYLRDGYVFQSNYAAGLRILDASTLAAGSMTEVGYFDTYPANDRFNFDGQWSNYPYFASGTVIANDINNGLFVLKPDVLAGSPGGTGPIAFTAPVGGEVLNAGTTYTVTWSPGGVPAGVTMKLNLKSATEGNSTIANSVPNTGSYEWAIPATQASATDYRIIGVYTDPDTGDKVRPKTTAFEITGGVPPPTPITVTAPASGAVWAAGTTQTVTWDPGDIPASTTLQVRLIGNGNTRLEKNVLNDGSWDWEVPVGQTPATGYKIMLVYTDPTTGSKVKPKSGAFEITTPPAAKTATLALGAATPNPVRGRATLPFSLPEAGPVRVSVHDARGREVALLVDGYRQAGAHEAVWEAGDLAPGVYVIRLAAGMTVSTRRVVVVQ